MLTLPGEFADLEQFGEWILPTARERSAKRVHSSMEEIKSFYNAMIARMPEIIAFMAKLPYSDGMSVENKRLLDLTLSLAEIGPAVEWYNQPRVTDGFDVLQFELTEELP